jgi:hypothetical protein
MFQKLIFILPLLIMLGIPQVYALTTENHVATAYWEQAGYPVKNNKAKIIVEEPDMNKYPQSIDRFDIHVFSDSDSTGVKIRITETSVNSGIFEGFVILTTDPSRENRLHATDGDTITAKYVDTTLPQDHPEELDIVGTAFVGSRGPPLERVPATDLRLYNTKGNRISEIAIDQQIEIMADLQNSQNNPQKFAYLAQIQNERGETVLLSWIDGTMDTFQALSPSISWIPNVPGQYIATIFVWESIENPTALSPPLSLDLKVIPKQFDGKEFSNEKFVKITLLDYEYSYTTKEHLNFGIKLEGYYDTIYPPKVSVRDSSGKTVWNNWDFVRNTPHDKTAPTDFSERYDINDIGGPINLKGGKYTLNVKFEDWNIQRDLFVR